MRDTIRFGDIRVGEDTCKRNEELKKVFININKRI